VFILDLHLIFSNNLWSNFINIRTHREDYPRPFLIEHKISGQFIIEPKDLVLQPQTATCGQCSEKHVAEEKISKFCYTVYELN